MPFSATSARLLMPESLLHLEAREQSQIYRALAPQLARSPVVLEKDVWVCWALRALFTMPDRLPMAFKGGTSLSKVFGVISRFSEDVDITLDYRGLDGSFDPFADGLSRTRLRKFSEDLKSLVREHINGVVAPCIHKMMGAEFGTHVDGYRLEVSDDGEQMRLHYPTALQTSGQYIGNSVLIEFGGRNITEPSTEHSIEPDIAPYVPSLDLPRGMVNVLSPVRTFWEKATLMHVECQRNGYHPSADRMSRHWYDLAMLADHVHGEGAIADRSLLLDVVRHKQVFYNAGYANYDACLIGQLRLVPDEPVLGALREDFHRMIDAGMFVGDPPDFDVIVDRLRALETAINRH